MEAYAIHKGAMIAPRKARMTIDLIRGKSITEARAVLVTTNTKASRLISKVLERVLEVSIPDEIYEEMLYII